MIGYVLIVCIVVMCIEFCIYVGFWCLLVVFWMWVGSC